MRCARHADRAYDRHRRAREARELTRAWAIPWPVVSCESEGANKPPNSASASGYYQIIRSTWLAYGGGRYAPEAWLASKAEQGAIARAILARSPRGLGEWDCARILGYA